MSTERGHTRPEALDYYEACIRRRVYLDALKVSSIACLAAFAIGVIVGAL